MKRTLMTLFVVGLGALAMATAGFLGVFNSTYKVSMDSEVGKAGCGACHASSKGGKLNNYGKDVKSAMGSSKKLTAANLKAVEGKDSDGDGVNNGDELKKGSNPGK